MKQAVTSVLNQTFSDFELLIYDDGSDAKFAKTIREYEKMDDRICVIRSDRHHCLAYGLNELISRAKGAYIARMDADDICHPERLERELRFLEAHQEYSYVGSNLQLIDERGEAWGKRKYPVCPRAEDFLSYQPYAHPAMMFRAEVLSDEKPYGDYERDRRGEDYEMLMRFTSEGKRGYNLQEYLLWYRETPNGYRKRRLKFQLQEVKIRWRGFGQLGFNRASKFTYIMKPLAVWAVPNHVIYQIKKRDRG